MDQATERQLRDMMRRIDAQMGNFTKPDPPETVHEFILLQHARLSPAEKVVLIAGGHEANSEFEKFCKERWKEMQRAKRN
jgi:hypothetical protein